MGCAVKKFYLMSNAEENAFYADNNYAKKLPEGACFISYNGDNGEAQLTIPLDTLDVKEATIRANAFLKIVNEKIEGAP